MTVQKRGLNTKIFLLITTYITIFSNNKAERLTLFGSNMKINFLF